MHVAPCRNGFTLTDLLITVLLIGLFSLMAMPAFQDLASGAKLDSAAAELVSSLEYAGSLAIRYRRPFLVTVSQRYSAFAAIDSRYEGDMSDHPDADPPVWAFGIVAHPVDRSRYLIDFNATERFEGVRISAIKGASSIRFYPEGHCSTEATSITVTYGGDSRTVSIDGITGRVTVR